MNRLITLLSLLFLNKFKYYSVLFYFKLNNRVSIDLDYNEQSLKSKYYKNWFLLSISDTAKQPVSDIGFPHNVNTCNLINFDLILWVSFKTPYFLISL